MCAISRPSDSSKVAAVNSGSRPSAWHSYAALRLRLDEINKAKAGFLRSHGITSKICCSSSYIATHGMALIQKILKLNISNTKARAVLKSRDCFKSITE